MRFLGWNLLLAAWLVASTFALGSTPSTQAATWVAAAAVGAVAIVSVGRPAARFAISGIAFALAMGALLVPELSTAAAVSDAVVAAILFALSVSPSAHVSVPRAVKP